MALPLAGGVHNGPLFEHGRVRRAPQPRMQSTFRNRVERRRTPPWADRAATRALYVAARALTRSTGIRRAVDHVVPLNHPLVCGLHWAGNLRVARYDENLRKSNAWWPDMWERQATIDEALEQQQ